jgi:hypothetical protein
VNKRALRRRLHRSMAFRGYLGAVVVTMRTVPHFDIPRWSPGPEWIEAAAGYCWFKPCADGQHEVMVYTYDREAADQNQYREALVSAKVPWDSYWGTFVDKPHRIYNWALDGTLRTQEASGEARRYNCYVSGENEIWRRRVYELGHQLGKERGSSLVLSPQSTIAVTGDAWMNSVEAWADTRYLAEDLDAITCAVDQLVRWCRPVRLHITKPTPQNLVDPLWQPAMAALKRAEEQS